jgi:predicted RNase H-like HicB family nuclease
MRYAVVIEKGKKNHGVYIPDVPGCVSVGDTVEECLTNIREALQLHFNGMHEDADKIPDPLSLVDYVDVPMGVPLSRANSAKDKVAATK